MATSSSYPVPPIFFNQFNDVSHLHGPTVSVVFVRVNICPVNCLSLRGVCSAFLVICCKEPFFSASSKKNRTASTSPLGLRLGRGAGGYVKLRTVGYVHPGFAENLSGELDFHYSQV